jgi:hypothetical protein
MTESMSWVLKVQPGAEFIFRTWVLSVGPHPRPPRPGRIDHRQSRRPEA